MCVFHMNVCLFTTCVKFPLRPEEGSKLSELELSKVVMYQYDCLEPNAGLCKASECFNS